MANAPRVERKRITDFQPDPANANNHSERGLRALDDSLAEVGLGRSIVVDKHGTVLAGNFTQERAVDQGFDEALVVHTTGQQLVVVQRDDLDLSALDDTRARKLAYYDNRSGELSLNWNPEQLLADMQAGVDLSNLWQPDELGALLSSMGDVPDFGGDTDTDEDAPDIPLGRWDVPDAIFPTDNDYEIPLLDITLQARSFDLPFAVWGTMSRQSALTRGTYAFYVSDDRFEALWRDPSGIVNSGCANIVEPNFSCYATMPVAVGAYQIYRKRWIARWCQLYGVRTFVDLNVAAKWRELNLLGVPQGWASYCTRGSTDYVDELDAEFALACERAGVSNPLFVVYGGGRASKERCKARGWLWVNDQQTAKRKLMTEMDDGE